ncbi:MAG: hypothetical protein R3E89_05125 [Thiolinea sp.]
MTTALHPDRETDATEQGRKTELMQKVTRAYRDKDLLRLLELQLEIEQIDQHKIDGIAEDRLKYFNKVLERQLSELQMEINSVSMIFKEMAGMDFFSRATPAQIMQRFEADTRQLEQDALNIENDLITMTTVKRVQQWLKDYRLPHDDWEDFFVMAPGFGR